MRIAVLSDTIYPTPTPDGHGLGRGVYNAASQLVKLGHDVTLFGLEGSELPGGCVVSTPIAKIASERFLASGIIKYRASFDVALDAGHSHSLAKEKALPTAAWFHDIGSERAPNAVFVSEYCRDAVGMDGPVVRNAVDPDAYPLYDGERGDYVLFLGNGDPHKGGRDAERAANIAGRELRAHGKGCPHGSISGEEKIKAIQHAAAVLCPYRIDAGAHVPLEAMMCGTPVIARAAGCMFEYVPKGGGILCDTPQAMASLIPFVGQFAGAGARKAVIDAGFIVDRLGIETEAILERVANGERW